MISRAELTPLAITTAAVLFGSACQGTHAARRPLAPSPVGEWSPGLWVDRRVDADLYPVYHDIVPTFGPEAAGVVPRLMAAFRSYYDNYVTRETRDACDVDAGEICVLDPMHTCRGDCESEEDRRRFFAELTGIITDNPGSILAVTQAVYAAMRLGYPAEARRYAGVCPGRTWWCAISKGYLLHRSGRTAEAEAVFRSGVDRAPGVLACRLRDVSALLPREHRKRYAYTPCEARADIHAYFWWLTDPILTTLANERWVEHVARRWEYLLAEQLRVILNTSDYAPAYESYVMRRGFEDSWANGSWTSKAAAPYHFAPESMAWMQIDSTLRYRLEAELDDEGAMLPGFTLTTLDGQVARFRDGDSLSVAAAAALETSDPALVTGPVRGHLMLSTSPDGPGVSTVLTDSPYAGMVKTVGEPQILAFEIIGEAAAARMRRPILPLSAEGPAVSDLLLFRVVEGAEDAPENRDAVVAAMMPHLAAAADTELGVYWEGYEMGSGAVVETSIGVEGTGAGLLRRLGRFFGIGEARTSNLSWEEVADSAGGLRRSFSIDLSSLEPGEYVVTLELRLVDGQVLESRRRFDVKEALLP